MVRTAAVTLKISALAACFFEEVDVLDFDALVERFGHVVDGERGDRGGGERLHLDTSLRGSGGGGDDAHAAGFHGDLDIGMREGQGMAERNQLGGLLGGHDAGDAGDFERIAFGIGGKGVENGAAHADEGVGASRAGGDGLAADIDHAGLSGGIVVREFAHFRRTGIRSPAA
jgi:hypothetical protein